MNKELIFCPIPMNISLDGWEQIKINECNENIVKINDLNPKIVCEEDHFARETVANMLILASELLPKDCKLLIIDAYRSFETQKTLFENYYNSLKKQFATLSESDIIKMTSKYVAIPSDSQNAPSPHLTGGAIDLTIIKDGCKIEMGSIDGKYMKSDKSAFFEELINRNENLPLDSIYTAINRRLLYNIMTTIGFTNNPNELWHYDYGNQSWAKIGGTYAIYGIYNM